MSLDIGEFEKEIWADIEAKLCAKFGLTTDELDRILSHCYEGYRITKDASFFLNMKDKVFWKEISKIIIDTKPVLGILGNR